MTGRANTSTLPFSRRPLGIRRMFIWLVPFGHDITFTIGIFTVNIIVGGIIGIFVLAWKLVVAAWYIPLTIYRLVTVRKGGGRDIYIEE